MAATVTPAARAGYRPPGDLCSSPSDALTRCGAGGVMPRTAMQILRRALLLLGLVASPWPAAAQAPVALEAVVERYLAAQTYCETGKRFFPIPGEVPFSLCADGAGRFKYTEDLGRPQESVEWSDGPVVHTYRKDTRAYEEYSRSSPRAANDGFATGRPPAARSRLLRQSFIGGEALDRPQPLRGFAYAPALSTASESVFERFHAGTGRWERLRVRNADGTMTAYEHVDANGIRQHYVELSSVRIDGPLAVGDLSFSPGLLARYSLRNSPLVFLAAVLVLCSVAAGLGWGRVFARAAQPQRIAHWRSSAWRWWRWLLLVTAAFVAVLTVLSILNPGSGHPPAIVVPLWIGLVAAVVFTFWACLLLVSYPVQRLVAGRAPAPRRPRPQPGPAAGKRGR